MTKIIPFWMLPSSWFLHGKDWQIGYTKYYYTGEELDNKLNIIENAGNNFNYLSKENDIQYKYNRKTLYEYEKEKLYLDYNFKKTSKKQYDISLLELGFNHGIIDEQEYELEKINCEIKSKNSVEYKKSILQHELKFDIISREEYDYNILDFIYDKNSYDWRKAKIDLDLKYGKISEQKWNNADATIRGEPYFEVISGKFETKDNESASTGMFAFEYDYNSIFVERLKEEGYTGYTDEQIVDEYFKELCKQLAYEEEIFEMTEPTFGPIIETEENKLGITRYS